MKHQGLSLQKPSTDQILALSFLGLIWNFLTNYLSIRTNEYIGLLEIKRKRTLLIYFSKLNFYDLLIFHSYKAHQHVSYPIIKIKCFSSRNLIKKAIKITLLQDIIHAIILKLWQNLCQANALSQGITFCICNSVVHSKDESDFTRIYIW